MVYYRPNGNNMRAAHARRAGEEATMSGPGSRRRDDDAAFPLPISGLFADLELGVGAVNLPDGFFAASSAIQIEIIADWQREFEVLRLRAMVKLYRDLAAALPQCSEAEKLERFRVTCQSLELDFPEDMPALLAKYE
jgi:hypothetical protein